MCVCIVAELMHAKGKQGEGRGESVSDRQRASGTEQYV